MPSSALSRSLLVEADCKASGGMIMGCVATNDTANTGGSSQCGNTDGMVPVGVFIGVTLGCVVLTAIVTAAIVVKALRTPPAAGGKKGASEVNWSTRKLPVGEAYTVGGTSATIVNDPGSVRSEASPTREVSMNFRSE